MRKKDRARRVAYHEAGHALMTCLVRGTIRSASIAPDGVSSGRVICWPRTRTSVRLYVGCPDTFHQRTDAELRYASRRKITREHRTILAAGEAAEVLVFGTSDIADLWSSGDFIRARMMAWTWATLVARIARRLARHRGTLDRLASALLMHTTLTGREVRAICRGDRSAHSLDATIVRRR